MATKSVRTTLVVRLRRRSRPAMLCGLKSQVQHLRLESRQLSVVLVNNVEGPQLRPFVHQPMRLTASAGAAIGMPSKLASDSRSSSPVMMSSTLAAIANAST